MIAKINSIHYAARLWHALFSRCQDFKENFTFTPKYSGILILLNPEYLILLYEANTSDDQAQKNRTWSIWKKPTLRDTFFTGLLRLFLFKWKNANSWGARVVLQREGSSHPGEARPQKQHPCTTSCSHYYSLQRMLTAKVQRLLCFPCSWC